MCHAARRPPQRIPEDPGGWPSLQDAYWAYAFGLLHEETAGRLQSWWRTRIAQRAARDDLQLLREWDALTAEIAEAKKRRAAAAIQIQRSVRRFTVRIPAVCARVKCASTQRARVKWEEGGKGVAEVREHAACQVGICRWGQKVGLHGSRGWVRGWGSWGGREMLKGGASIAGIGWTRHVCRAHVVAAPPPPSSSL